MIRRQAGQHYRRGLAGTERRAAKIAFLKAADINVRIRPVKAEERSALVRPAGKVEASFLSRTHAGWLLGDPETITGTLEELKETSESLRQAEPPQRERKRARRKAGSTS